MNEESKFWRVVGPDQWPEPPERLSPSSAHEIEACPRRWSLRRADYRSSIGQVGYPERANPAAVAGLAAHLALERLTGALEGMHPSNGAAVTSILKGLGGISAILQRAADEVLGGFAENPRGLSHLGDLRLNVARRIPALRALLQAVLQQIFVATNELHPTAVGGKPRSVARAPLGQGYHPEVELRPRDLDWVGRVDALRIDELGCEIIDYKTGERAAKHNDQLRTYAVLWALDGDINPGNLPVTQLSLIYPSGGVAVDVPTLGEIPSLVAELRERGTAIVTALRNTPPTAIVAPPNCEACDVRHLCDSYWSLAGQTTLALGAVPRWRTVEMTVRSTRGPHSYDVVIDREPHIPSGTPSIIIGSSLPHLRSGSRVRALDVLVDDETDGPPLIQYLASSELFQLDMFD